MSVFSSRLKSLRKEKKLSQEDLAKKIGVLRHNIADREQERSEPDIDMLIKLSDYFNVSIDFLLGKTDIRNSFAKEDILVNPIKTKNWINEELIMAGIIPTDKELSDEETDDLIKNISDAIKLIKHIKKNDK